jgi:hypothetical protein
LKIKQLPEKLPLRILEIEKKRTCITQLGYIENNNELKELSKDSSFTSVILLRLIWANKGDPEYNQIVVNMSLSPVEKLLDNAYFYYFQPFDVWPWLRKLA